MAGLLNSTYDFSTSATGNTQIGATPGTYTDPANPGFCVGPPVACGSGSGVSGGFSFADINANLSQITFTYFGSTAGAGPGSFSINLANFILPSGAISHITQSGGNLGGATASVSWNGATATFTDTTGSDYDAIGGTSVVFNVALRAVPEPGDLLLVTTGLGALALVLRKRRTQTSA